MGGDHGHRRDSEVVQESSRDSDQSLYQRVGTKVHTLDVQLHVQFLPHLP